MSLFTDGEVCGTCEHATMYDCGNCLKKCNLGLRYDACSGACEGYDGPSTWLTEKAEELRKALDRK